MLGSTNLNTSLALSAGRLADSRRLADLDKSYSPSLLMFIAFCLDIHETIMTDEFRRR